MSLRLFAGRSIRGLLEVMTMNERRFVVQRFGQGMYVVAERGKRRIAVFNKLRPAERYRDALNAGAVTA